MGLPYVFADFINPVGEPMAAYYRDNFQPSARCKEPRVGVAVWAICADSDEEALLLSASFRMVMLSLYRGQLIAVPPIERAMAFLAKEGVAIDELPAHRRIITGTPQKVCSAIEAVAADYAAQEVFVVNILYDHAARRRSYQLIAHHFSL